MRTRLTQAFLIIAALVFAGCESDGGRAASDPERSVPRIIFVTHGQASDPFWSVVQNGASMAAEDMGAVVEYQAPESFDMVTMGQLIDAAVASDPDGLVVSVPDEEALAEPVSRAVRAGIPVVTINSGHHVADRLGALTHIGQTEYEAGYGGGEKMAEAGVRNALCVNAEVGNTALDLRCNGFADAMREQGATVDVLAVEVGDPAESQQRIQASLSSQPGIDGLLALGPTSALPALAALRATQKSRSVQLATFDMTPEILQAIADGEILFAIDQQQYLQGYLPVVFLSLHLRNANSFPNDVIRTGPGFVTRENVDRLRDLTARGTR